MKFSLKEKKDPEEELSRLLSNEKIKASLTTIENNLNAEIPNKKKLAIAHSLEIREALKDDFYVINHGQNLNLILLNIVARSLMKHFNANNYEHLRMLKHDADLKHIDPIKQDVKWFKKKLHKESDHSYRRELICGDIFLESTAEVESALDFFLGRTNIAVRDASILSGISTFERKIAKSILKYYFHDKNTRKLFLKELQFIRKGFQSGGNLYSIAIPKEKFHEICYLSKSYGTPIKKGIYEKNELELLQAGVNPFPGSRVPQVRLLSHKLTPENGAYIYVSSSAEDKLVKKAERQIDLLVQRAQMQFRL